MSSCAAKPRLVHPMRKVAYICVFLLASCAALDTVVDVFDPITGDKTGETTVGDIVAGTGEAAGDAAGAIVSGVTGNPLLGTAAAAGIAGLFMGARRKRKAKADA